MIYQIFMDLANLFWRYFSEALGLLCQMALTGEAKHRRQHSIFFKILPPILLVASVEETSGINVHLRLLEGVLQGAEVPMQEPPHSHRHAQEESLIHPQMFLCVPSPVAIQQVQPSS